MQTPTPNLLTPKTVLQERYRVVRQIGRGGMGAVYEATDLRLKIPVALKQTLVSGAQFRKAFQREALLLARLRHPALPVVTDYFVEGEAQFLVMQYMPGLDLAALHLKRGQPFPLRTVLDWADQLLEALSYLHEQEPPVIHRDIKPQNLKLAANGAIILLDFGLAKGAATQSQLASSSLFGYTPHYAPLEQIRGGGTNARSDLYALAATLYHLLTDGPPISAMERAEATVNGLPDPLVALSAANPEVPEAIGAPLMRALDQRADARPASAAALREALATARRELALAATAAEPTTVLATDTQPDNDPELLASLDQPDPSATPPSSLASATALPKRSPGRWRWQLPTLGAALVLGLGVGIPMLRANPQAEATPPPTLALAAPSPSLTWTASPTVTSTPTATATATPTATATSTPTITATPTRTPRPTARPRPTASPTPLPPTTPPTEAPTPTSVPPSATPTDQPGTPRRRSPSAPATAIAGTPTDQPTSEAYPGPDSPTAEPTDAPPTTIGAPTAASEPTTQPSLQPAPTP